MRTIEEIFNSVPKALMEAPISYDEMTAIQRAALFELGFSLISYEDELAQLGFGKDRIESDLTLDTLIEILPNDKERIKKLKEKADVLQKKDWGGNPNALTQSGPISADRMKNREVEFAFQKFWSAITTKDKILEKITEEKSTLKENVILAANIMKNLTYDKRTQRIIFTIQTLKEILVKLPLTEREKKINDSLEQLINYYNELKRELGSRQIESILMDLAGKCERGCRENINKLCESLKAQIKSIVTDIPPSVYESLAVDYKQMFKAIPALSISKPSGDATQPSLEIMQREKLNEYLQNYNNLLENFKNKFLELLKKVKEAPHLPVTLAYSDNQSLAEHRAHDELPEKDYPYLLSSKDLKKSENQSLEALSDENSIRVADPTRYILSAKEENNLHQIFLDIQRKLKINNKSFTHIEEKKLPEILEKELGKENLALLIRHFEQNITYLLGAAINTAVGDTQQIPAEAIRIVNPDYYFDNIYVFNELMFRNTDCKELIIAIPLNSNDPDKVGKSITWNFKANLKIISWFGLDGVFVQNYGLDSSLLTNCLMNKNCYFDIASLVTTIDIYEKDFLEKTNRLETFSGKSPHKKIIQEAQALITQFKAGSITFDELTAKVIEKANEATKIPHESYYGKAKQALFGKPTGTFNILDDFKNALLLIKNNVDLKAAKYLRKKAEVKLENEVSESKNPPQSPFLKGGRS